MVVFGLQHSPGPPTVAVCGSSGPCVPFRG
jgi:hypothetical protein